MALTQLTAPVLVRLLLAAALGLFLGIEREWSHRSAGIRTFSLISLLGAVFTVLEEPWLLALGGLLIVLQGTMLAVRGLLEDDTGLGLTTGVSMMVAYGVGVLVGSELLLAGVTVAILSSMLLVLKRELHDFAWGLSRAELRSAIEFGVLAFVIYPLLPPGETPVWIADLRIAIEPRVIWLLVVSIAAIGIINYAVVRSYGGRGVVVTGFFGGLVSSTAVVGAMVDHVRSDEQTVSYAVAAILLADGAMALRNLAIVVAFATERWQIRTLIVPLGGLIIASIVIAYLTADWSQQLDLSLESPFSLRNALGFGALFAVVLVGAAIATAIFGNAGFFVAAFLGSLISSAGATTSAIVLYNGGAITAATTIVAVMVATVTSILVKAALISVGPSQTLRRRVVVFSIGLSALGVLLTGIVVV
ncbi:MgtC/SapB family protein [Halocatena halophila]|uniref:MgtC/SapB family protein n=1 Tax=Halocatena halophila TaxID=2814576 RepID=UPI002ED610CC